MQEVADHVKGPFDAFLDEEFVVAALDAKKFWKASASTAANTVNLFAQQSSMPYNPDDMDSVGQWLISKVEHTLDWLSIPLRCAYCQEMYEPVHNLGSWDCRWHPGELLGAFYSCCGGDNSRGCQPCDHSPIYKTGQPRWTFRNSTIRVPQLLFRILQFQIDSVIENVQDDEDVARSYFWLNRAPTKGY
jgi:hypothetical protein